MMSQFQSIFLTILSFVLEPQRIVWYQNLSVTHFQFKSSVFLYIFVSPFISMECGMIFDVCVSKLMLINCLVDELTPSIYVFGVEKKKL